MLSKIDIPINLLDLDTTSKLAYWIKHLPYYKYYTSHYQHTTKNTSVPTTIEINKSELLLSQQIADTFYENSISGCTLDKFSKNDYNDVLENYKDSIHIEHDNDNDNNNNYIKYIYELIYESQQYYQSNNKYTKNVTEMKQLENKNWIINTYKKYVLLITELLTYITPNEPNDDHKSNQLSVQKKGIQTTETPKETETYPSPPTGEIFIKSPTQKWRACKVIDVLENGRKWKIHYKDFGSKYDEIIDYNSTRLTTIKPENVIPKKIKIKSKTNVLNKENRVWVQSTTNANIHRECIVRDETDTQLKIHFISYHEKHDILIDKTSPRIKKTRPSGNKLIKGDNLSCYSNKMKSWLEVEIIKVNNNKNEVKVGWIGKNNLKSIWLKMDDNRLSITHKKHTDPSPLQ